jgi:hypothetical protein
MRKGFLGNISINISNRNASVSTTVIRRCRISLMNPRSNLIQFCKVKIQFDELETLEEPTWKAKYLYDHNKG